MRNINTTLRQVYFEQLSATGNDVYYAMAPDGQTGNYIVFKPTSNGTIPQFTETTAEVQMEVVIYTEGEKYNNGNDADAIAEQVYGKILPSNGFVLSLPNNLVMINTELVSDNVNTWTLKDVTVCIDRTIIFKHTIYLN